MVSQCTKKQWWLKKSNKSFKRLDHAHIVVNASFAHDYQLPMSVRLILPHHMRLNTSIVIFWIHKLHLILENRLSWMVIHVAFSVLDSWRKYQCLGMTSLYMFWCGILISIWMSKWDCQNKLRYDQRGPPKNILEDKSKEQIEATT